MNHRNIGLIKLQLLVIGLFLHNNKSCKTQPINAMILPISIKTMFLTRFRLPKDVGSVETFSSKCIMGSLGTASILSVAVGVCLYFALFVHLNQTIVWSLYKYQSGCFVNQMRFYSLQLDLFLLLYLTRWNI